MAKKSAKSKGFRKQQAKKPYLTRREIVVVCVLAVLVIAAAILAATYNDGALKLKNGKVVDAGENWLIVNGSTARGRSRYFKVGEVGEIDGYTRENNPLADVNVPQYVYTPDAEDAPINSLSITSSHNPAQALAEYMTKAMATVTGTEVSEIATAAAGGVDYVYCTSVTDVAAASAALEQSAEALEEAVEADAPEEEGAGEAPDEAGSADEAEAAGADEAEAATPNFTETFSAFVDCAHDSCVVVDIHASAATREALPDDEAMKAIVEQAVATVALEPAK